MKVLHTISGLNIYSGGPSQSVFLLTKSLISIGIDARILSFGTNESNEIISTESFIHTIPLSSNTNLIYSRQFVKYLVKNINYDIYHGHGIWQLPVHYMANTARKNKSHYIITPRGMLEPWSLEQSKLKKKIALKLYQYKDLENASCIHATSIMEAENIRKLGFNNSIAIIPNGLNISEFPVKAQTQPKDLKTILFLSRIHPKKGIELLIEAWSRLDKSLRKGWRIDIVGSGDEEYIEKLQQLILNKELKTEMKFIGPKFGAEKIDIYRQADLFVLPTYSENFGNVVAEALACGVPVITTKGAPWEELKTRNAGWWIDIAAEPLAKALTKAMQLNDDERMQMGLNGRKLVEEKYSIEIIAKKMIKLYEWILYKTEKPEFVI